MEMFLEHADHSSYLLDCVDAKPTTVFIASFGIYAGISYSGQDTTEWGPKYQLATRDMMELMREIPKRDKKNKVYILIGIAPYKSCNNGKCLDCERKYAQGLVRLSHHVNAFPEFKWRANTELHLKSSLFFYSGKKGPKGVAGGRNFSDSGWADVTFTLTQSNIYELFKHLMSKWNDSRVLNDTTIGEILEEQGVSEEGFQAISRPF